MLKPTSLSISESNLANFGTELEFKIKLAAAEGEPAFREIGIRTRLWRVRQFRLEEVSTTAPDFFRGDCYLALGVAGTARSPIYTVYYWIGDESTIDEAGTAAYKAYELDTLLTRGAGARHGAVQHREVCGAESQQFLDIFPGARILDGGYDSGFHRVERPERRKRLLQVGQEKLTEVACEWKTLQPDGVYILDAGTVIYQWTGRDSPLGLRAPAMAAVRALDDARGINSTVIVITQDETCADFNNFVRALQESNSPAHGSRGLPLSKPQTRSLMMVATYTSWVDGKFTRGEVPGHICIEDRGDLCCVTYPPGAGPFPALCAMAYFDWAGKTPVTTLFYPR